MQISPDFPLPAPPVRLASPAVFAQPSKHPLLQRRRILPQGILKRSQSMLGYAVSPLPAPFQACVRGEEVGVEGDCGFPPLGATAQRLRAEGKRAGVRRTPTHGAGTVEAGAQRAAGFCLIRLGCVSLHLPAYVCY